jgi:hypothetical protein
VTKSTLISKGIFEYWQTWSDFGMGAAHPDAVRPPDYPGPGSEVSARVNVTIERAG